MYNICIHLPSQCCSVTQGNSALLLDEFLHLLSGVIVFNRLKEEELEKEKRKKRWWCVCVLGGGGRGEREVSASLRWCCEDK